MLKKAVRIGALTGLLLSTACGHLVYADGPYRGRVLDVETKRPIEGAAVVAIWRKQTPVIAHPDVTFYEAQEAVTDQEGNFTIPGIWGGAINPLAKIRKPSFLIFKPGYEAYGERQPERNEQRVVELRRLTTRAARIRNLSRATLRICTPELPEGLRDVSPYCVPREKIPNFINLKELEESNLGLTPRRTPKGESQ